MSWAGSLAALCLVALGGCGARSQLRAGEAPTGAGGATTTTTTTTTSGSGAAGGGGGSELPLCSYQSAGPPLPIVQFPDRHAASPSLAVVSSGNLAPRVALQTMASGGSSSLHPDIRVAEIRVGAAWPDDAEVTQPPVLFGPSSHSWGELAHSPPSVSELALAWYSDPGEVGRVAFRPLTIATWTPGPVVDVALDGEVALALAPGAAVGPFGVGYGGEGYGLVLRRRLGPEAVQPAAVVLDLDGQVLLGPHAVTAAGASSPSPSAVWSGEAYLMATAFATCAADDPLCVPNAVVVTRIRPATGDAWDDSGVDPAGWFGAAELATTPRRPAIASYQGRTWLAWGEGPAGSAVPLAMRVAEVDASGQAIGVPVLVASGALPTNRPALVAGDHGLALVWIEPTGDDGPPDQPGVAELVVVALDHERQPLAPMVRLAITQPQLGIPSAVAVRTPRMLLVTWSGTPEGGGLDAAMLARFDCLPIP